jgi:hypothetical protein
MGLKMCLKCKVHKSKSDFHTDNRLKCGVKSKCKECYREYLTIPEYASRRARQSSESIKRSKEKVTDNYVIRMLCHHNELTPDDIRKLPELIAIKKQIIITNRIIKDEKSKKYRAA